MANCLNGISCAAIAGAGTMGVTLARIFAEKGYAVTLWNRRESSLEGAHTRIAGDLAARESAGAPAQSASAVLSRIRFTTSWEAFSDADFVLENIAEDLTIKRDFFHTLCGYVSDKAVLATNTSGLRVSDIAQAVARPERFCGMHWWNPPDLIPLVEITKGEQTGQETAELIRDAAVTLGKKPVIVRKDILGILGNRLQYAVLREALHILELGAAGPEEIDAAMKYGPGFRYPTLGPFETVDLGGLDLFRSVSNYLFAELGTETRSELLNRLADAGRYGVKNGAGFYDYAPGEGDAALRHRDEQFAKQLALLETP